jgi:hypothetical protein
MPGQPPPDIDLVRRVCCTGMLVCLASFAAICLYLWWSLQ